MGLTLFESSRSNKTSAVRAKPNGRPFPLIAPAELAKSIGLGALGE